MDRQYRLAENLKYFRKKHNLSEAKLAEELGMSQQGYSKYETGSSIPDAERLLWLADRYHVTTDFLLTGDPEQFPEGLYLAEEPGYASGQKASFPEMEKRLLTMFRPLPLGAKEEFLKYLEFRYLDTLP